MKTYYHNTTADNKDNMILGYLSNYGDFLTRAEVADQEFKLSDVGIWPTVKIVVEEGLLSAGETYEQFCKRVAEIALTN